MPAVLAEVLSTIDRLWPLEGAEPWDAPGLVTGDPDAAIERVLLAVAAVAATVDEAIELDADLLIAHHPLLLRGVTSIAEDRYKGALLARLIRADCALVAAHTNADVVERGTSAVMAARLGLVDVRPIVPGADAALGLGRVGRLPEPTTLGRLARLLADLLPPTATGVRAAGGYDDVVETVALCGGAGDSLLADPAVLAADVYITADLPDATTRHPRRASRRSWAAGRPSSTCRTGRANGCGSTPPPRSSARPTPTSTFASASSAPTPGTSRSCNDDHFHSVPDEEHHVKASPAEQQELLRLQSLDTRLQQLAHRLGALPQAAPLSALAARDTAVRGTRAEAIGGLEDARAELKRLESDVAVVEARIARDGDRLQHTSSVKDVAALGSELSSLAKRLSDLEDQELVVMERVETAEATLAGIDADRASIAGETATLEAERDEAAAGLPTERDAAERGRIEQREAKQIQQINRDTGAFVRQQEANRRELASETDAYIERLRQESDEKQRRIRDRQHRQFVSYLRGEEVIRIEIEREL